MTHDDAAARFAHHGRKGSGWLGTRLAYWVLLAFGGLLSLPCVFPASRASDETSTSSGSGSPAAGAMPPAVPATPPTSSPVPLDDPLYQTILESLKAGRQPIHEEIEERVGSPSTPTLSTRESERTSSCDWRAIELMLRSARLLERDARRLEQAGQATPAKRHRKVIETLRQQVIELIADRSVSDPSP